MRTLALSLLLAAPALADDVELKSGTVVSGRVEDLGDSIRLHRKGGSVVYPKFMIRKITPRKTEGEIYLEKAKALKGDDLAGHLRLARWCTARELEKEAALEFEKVIGIDPDHAESRAALGHERHEGKWLTKDEINKAKGLVKHEGRWMTPEERDLQVALVEKERLDRELARKADSLLRRVRSTTEKTRRAAIDGLAQIADEHKEEAFLRGITSSYEAIRRYVYGELGRMKSEEAVKPLVRKSLWDSEEELRDVAASALRAIGHPDTALHYVKFLGEESVSARIRCVELMSGFGDARIAGVLIAAMENADARIEAEKDGGPFQANSTRTLVTRRVMVVNGRTVVVPKVVRVAPKAPDNGLVDRLLEEKGAIRGALRRLTGKDFGADPAAWRRGLAAPPEDARE